MFLFLLNKKGEIEREKEKRKLQKNERKKNEKQFL